MKATSDSIAYLNQYVYKPCGLLLQNLRVEKQNEEYEGSTFTLNEVFIRHRTAKITPKKIGQFVAIWEKDEHNDNRPFLYEHSPEFLVVNTFTNEHRGQFVFPRNVLREKGILSTPTQKGKMALRVYPVWDTPTSKQAVATQKWQLLYFLDFTEEINDTDVKRLYAMSN